MSKKQRARKAAEAHVEPVKLAMPFPDAKSFDPLEWLFGPQPIARLEILRILIPLAVLGFMSSRIIHANHWIGDAGFSVPDLGGTDYRQPLYIAPIPAAAAWVVAAAMVLSGLMLSAGAFTRIAGGVFSGLLLYVALADRLAAFTVSKIGVVLCVALTLSPAGARWSVDAWRRRRRHGHAAKPTHVSGGSVRFFQLFLPVFYFASGVAKYRGDWWDAHDHGPVIWTHLHDSYQTGFAYLVGELTPAWGWSVFQLTTLAFEALAPLWFGLPWTRPWAMLYGLAMHLMIGLMFGPVIWFSLLMMSLLVGCYLPMRWLGRVMRG